MDYDLHHGKAHTMVGTAGSGFLQGYVETTLKLEGLKRKREYEDERLAVQKERLGLYRKALDGQLASRKIQDQVREASLEKLLRDLGVRLRSSAGPQDPVGGTLPFGTDLGTPDTEQFLREYGRRQPRP